MKRHYIILSLLALLSAAPAVATETRADVQLEAAVSEVAVYVEASGDLRIVGAKGKTVVIYSLTGVRVASFELGSDDETIRPNLHRGGYLVKVDQFTRKIIVK